MESLGDLIHRNMIPMIPKKQSLETDFSQEGKEELLIYHEKVCKQLYLLKEAFAERLIEAAEEVIPGLSENIMVKDITTPLTYESYTLSTNGAWYDMSPTSKQWRRIGPKTPIKGLYTTGNKSYPGLGVYGATLSGVFTAIVVANHNVFNEIIES